MQFPEEVKAIKALRDAFPGEPAMKLAKRIAHEGPSAFETDEHKKHAASAGCRTFYSTYSVIRRYDAQRAKKADNKAAKAAVNKALANV